MGVLSVLVHQNMGKGKENLKLQNSIILKLTQEGKCLTPYIIRIIEARV
jgi:hypothetical protein